ncbi:MAG: ABC transporter ATP-binding protein [Deltaproteobacteria bacterium]|nr:ABC transporter ATP-binding protein [Deltaproteobacteria bacterium]
MPPTPAIAVADLTKVFRGFGRRSGVRALDGVSLEVPAGSAFGLIGLNGAGKTTLIKILLGVVHATAGRIQLLGGPPSDREIRQRIGYLPERLHLPPAFTPREFLTSVGRLKRLRDPAAEAERQLARVGLQDALGRKLKTFSKGMRQRTALAAALVGAPELLILDEPTDGIDPLGRIEVRHILEEERQRGATLFLNSHLLAETERVCDRIGILSEGRLLREGPLSELAGGAPRWRVRFSTGEVGDATTPELLAGLAGQGFAPDGAPGSFLVEAGDAATLNAHLDAARARGALILEVCRDLKDLEGILSEAVGQEGRRG